MLTYISNTDHYKQVLSRVQSVKHMLWIGTADIKDLYVEIGKEKKPFLALIAMLIRRGVEVRLIHAKEPGPNFREDFDKYPVLFDRLERVLCPRVHFKMLVFDGKEVYVGSANLTGTGLIKGFATTLLISIICSFYSAIFLSRLAFEWLLKKERFANMTFTTKMSQNFLKNAKVDFLGQRKKAGMDFVCE